MIDVLNDLVGRTDLVAVESNVQRGGDHSRLGSMMINLHRSHLVENGVVWVALFNILTIREKLIDASTVERKNANHVRDIKLHE